MARSAGFSSFGTNPFGTRSQGFSMFDAVAAGQEEYLAFVKVQVKWEAGQATDAEYLTALKVYADSLDQETSEGVNAQARYKDAQYTLARNEIVRAVDAGTRPIEDLLAFDTQAITGLNSASQEYRDRYARLIATKGDVASTAITKAKQQWDAGKITNSQYLTAFQAYVNAQTTPDDKAAAQAQLKELTYSLVRDQLVTDVNTGKATLAQLLTYDQQNLSGLVAGSQEYNDRLGRLQTTQNAVFSQQEQDKQDAWQKGQITSAQLLKWYQDASSSSLASGNQDLTDRIDNQVSSLQLRVQDERDSKMVSDYNDGKIGVNSFLAYASTARSRYNPNTPQYRDWSDRIDKATQAAVEDNLLYRYDLTRQYADLKRFIASGKAPKGGTGTQSQRIVLGADGNWKVVNTTTGGTGPSPSEQKAWADRQIQVADAKKQLAEIEQKISSLPGGWVSHDAMIKYYQQQQGQYTAGSSEWYTIQQRLDQVQGYKHQDSVYQKQGILVTYPWTPTDPQHVGAGGGGGGGGGAGTGGTGGRGGGGGFVPGGTKVGGAVGLDAFMRSVAQSESGGSYTLVHPQSGATGKYQFLPGTWNDKASQYLGNGGAPMTPENQEKVARAWASDMYKKYGDWRVVAIAWRNGAGWVSDHLGPQGGGSWSAKLDNLISSSAGNGAKWGQAYISKIANRLGGSLYTPLTTNGVLAGNSQDWGGGGGTPYSPGGGGTRSGGGGAASPYGPTAYGTPTTAGAPAPKTGRTGTGKTQDVTGVGSLRVYTGNTIQVHGKVIPQTAIAGIPDFAKTNPLSSGAGFEDFYRAYQKAYENGETSFVVWTLNGPISYALSGHPEQRLADMQYLDDLRINLHGLRAAAYAKTGDTDLNREAQQKWGESILDKGSNMMLVLASADTPFIASRNTGNNPSGPNPIYDASVLLTDTQKFVDAQYKFAQDAYDRGDYGAALAHIRQAQQHLDQAGGRLNNYLGQATAAIQQIEHQTGAPVPAHIAELMTKLQSWDSELDTSKLDQLSTEIVGTPGQANSGFIKKDTSGNLVYDPLTGQPVLRDGYERFLQPSGKIEVKPIPREGYVKDPLTGALKPGAKAGDVVRVTVHVGNTWVDAYAPYEITQIGQFSDGTPLYGKAVTDPNTGLSVVENPFTPGKWSQSGILINLPSGSRAVTDPANPELSQIEFVSSDGKTFRVSFVKDHYVVGQFLNGNFVDGTMQSLSTSSQNIGGWLQQNGFVRDTSGMSWQDRLMADTSGAVIGATGDQYRQFINQPGGFPGGLSSSGSFGAPKTGTTGFNPAATGYIKPSVGSKSPTGFNPAATGYIAPQGLGEPDYALRPITHTQPAPISTVRPPTGAGSTTGFNPAATGYIAPKRPSVIVPIVKPPPIRQTSPTGFNPNATAYIAPKVKAPVSQQKPVIKPIAKPTLTRAEKRRRARLAAQRAAAASSPTGFNAGATGYIAPKVALTTTTTRPKVV